METTVFVDNVNYVFKNLGITKAHVAKICGVSKATVSMWLGGRKPYRQSIETIADLFSDLLHLSISADQLLAEDLPGLLRKNAVKRVVIKKLVRKLGAMPIEDLVRISDQVSRLSDKGSPDSFT